MTAVVEAPAGSGITYRKCRAAPTSAKTRRQSKAKARHPASPKPTKTEMPETWCSPFAPGTGESTGADWKSAHDLEAGALINSGTSRIKPDSAHMKNNFLEKLHVHSSDLHERTWNY